MLPLTPQSFPGGGGTKLEADGRQANAADEPAAVAFAPRPSPLRNILTRAKQRVGRALRSLTPVASARTSGAPEAGGARPSLSSVLPALGSGRTIDLGRVEADQIADTPSVPVGAPADAAPTQPKRLTSVTIRGRVFTREEIMAQTTYSADGRSSSWTIPEPEETPDEAELSERMKEQVRELIWEELRERDRRSGADYRSSGLFLFRR